MDNDRFSVVYLFCLFMKNSLRWVSLLSVSGLVGVLKYKPAKKRWKKKWVSGGFSFLLFVVFLLLLWLLEWALYSCRLYVRESSMIMYTYESEWKINSKELNVGTRDFDSKSVFTTPFSFSVQLEAGERPPSASLWKKKVVQNPVRLQPNDSLAHLCVSFLFVYGVQSFGMKEK